MSIRPQSADLFPAFALTACATVALVAWAYWPVLSHGFVWDDVSSLRDDARLRNEAWKHVVLRDFGGWVNYFRPLVVLLFVAEIRAFHVAPEPMHAISLGLHLLDTVLVGLLARRIAIALHSTDRHTPFAAISMLFYGLHPALIEPLNWLGCQVELMLVAFTLLGLLLNASLASPRTRALCVGACFFLAACSKEAAIAFAPLLVLLDLAMADGTSLAERMQATWRRQRGVYLAVLLAGIAYLALRYWAMGYAVVPLGSVPLLSFARLQRVSETYLAYWKLIVWPMNSIGPVHAVDEAQFAHLGARSLAIDSAAIGVVLLGLHAFAKRRAIGALVLAVSVALLPVLNLVPVSFNEGLYHDRYATTAIALACALLPWVLAEMFARWRRTRLPAAPVALVWLGLAVVDIRVTTPLWGDEAALWQWASLENPGSITPKYHLLSTYIARNDHVRAREIADALVAEHPGCSVFMLNAANLAISENDTARAALALSKVRNTNALAYDRGILRGYVRANGELLELQGDLSGAEEAYRDAITLMPQDPLPQFDLALLFARHRRTAEARRLADVALALFPPDERERRRTLFERVLAQSQAQP